MVLVCAIWLVWTPRWHAAWGGMIIAFSISSGILVGVGFIVVSVLFLPIVLSADPTIALIGFVFITGIVLSLIGGSRAVRWGPGRVRRRVA